MNSAVPENIVRLLICPKCRHPVASDGNWLVCTRAACGLRYPVQDGIPIMLVEQAEHPARPLEVSPQP
jgi:uncharacterized protein YbaR (Trm112 family)